MPPPPLVHARRARSPSPRAATGGIKTPAHKYHTDMSSNPKNNLFNIHMRKTKKRVTAATKLQALARGKHVRSQQKRHRVQGGLSQGQATPPCFTHEEQAGQELDRSGWWWLVEGVVRRRTPVRPTIHQEHSIFDACERAWPRCCCTSLWTCVLAGYCRILMLTHSLTH